MNTFAQRFHITPENKKAPVGITPPGPLLFCIRLKEAGKAIVATAFSA